MDTFKFGLKYWKKYVPLSLLSKAFSLIAILCDLALPLIDAAIIDQLFAYDPAAHGAEQCRDDRPTLRV